MPRKQDVGKTAAATVISQMCAALKKQKRFVPEYLKVCNIQAQAELGSIQEATFGMYCFWSGERRLGKIPGVVYTRMGFIKGTGGANEVVRVGFNPKEISLLNLFKQAKKSKGAKRVIVSSEHEDYFTPARKVFDENIVATDNKFRRIEMQYSLRKARPDYYYLPICETQAVLMNSYYKDQAKLDKMLTPAQRKIREELAVLIKGNPKAVLRELAKLKPADYRVKGLNAVADYQRRLKAAITAMQLKVLEKGIKYSNQSDRKSAESVDKKVKMRKPVKEK